MANLSGFVKRLRDIMRNDAGINGDAQRIEQIAWMLFLKVYDAKEQDWEWDDENYVSIIPEECRWANWAHDDKSGTAMTGERLLDFVNNTLFPTLKKLPVDASTPIKKAIVQTTFADANNYMKDGVLLRQVINVIDELDLSDYEESHAFGEIYEAILKELQSAGSAGEFYTPRAVTEFMAQMIKPQIGEKMADFACGTGGFLTSWLKELEKEVKTTEDRAEFGQSIYGIEKKQFPYMLCITNMLLHDLDVPQVFHDNSLLRDVLDYTEEDQFDVILMNPPYGGSEKAEVKNHFPADLASSETADLFMSVIMYRLKENGRAAVILPDGFLFGTDNAKINIKKKLLSEFNLHTIIRMPGSVFSPYTSITTNILFFDRTGPTKETWFYRLDMPEGYKHFSKTKPMKLEHFAPVIEWWNNRREISVDGFDKARKYNVQQISEELGYNLDQCGFPHEGEEILAPMDLIQHYQEERASLNAIVDNALTCILSGLSGNEALELSNIATGALGRLSEIDKDFPEKMQKSILQMAIQGKLVEQRLEEGTGEELYQQIQRKKQALNKARKIKKEKPLPEIAEDEIPFEIPDTWRWIKLGEISAVITKGTTPRGGNVSYLDSGIGFLRAENVAGLDNLDKSNLKYIDENTHKGFLKRSILEANDILITIAGTLGRTAIVRDYDLPLNANQAIALVRLVSVSDVNLKYLVYALKSAGIQTYLTGQRKITAIPNLTLEIIDNCMIPLPPLVEQNRIVAKLEELLPLCEKLK